MILTDKDGFIHGMSANCVKGLMIPPTILPKARNTTEQSQLINIKAFTPNVLN